MVERSVLFEADTLLDHLQDAIDLIGGSKTDLYRMGRSIMKAETIRAFQTQSDPSSGARWPARERSYPWPPLMNTGTLLDSLAWGYGIKTRDGVPRFFGKVKDNLMYGGMWKGGKSKHPIVIAGAVHFGRSKRRSEKQTRMRAPGGGFLTPRTGAVPPRPIFGFGSNSRAKFKRQAERRLGRVFR